MTASKSFAPLALVLLTLAAGAAKAATPPPGATIVGYLRDTIPLFTADNQPDSMQPKAKLPREAAIVDIKENGLLGFAYNGKVVYVLRSHVTYRNLVDDCVKANLPARSETVVVGGGRMGGGNSNDCK